MYAIATITGFIASDPKINTTQNGTTIFSFSLPLKNRDKNTLWVNCKAFGKQAEAYSQSLRKGLPVSVSGKISPSFYTKKDGTNAVSLDMEIAPFCLQYPREDNQQQPVSQPQQQQYAPQPQQQQYHQQQYAPQPQQKMPYHETPNTNLDQIPF